MIAAGKCRKKNPKTDRYGTLMSEVQADIQGRQKPACTATSLETGLMC